MGWFDSLWNVVAPKALDIGADIVGGLITNSANKKAAKTATQATTDATSAITEGNRLAQQRLLTLQSQATPAVNRLNQIIYQPPDLTPEQQRAVDEGRRQTLGAVAVSGLRGSGRATTAAVRDVEGKLRDQFVMDNQKRSDAAANTLSGQYFNAGNNLANTEVSAGNTKGSAFEKIGDINANADLANASTTGKVIGDIGAMIADEMKNKAKPSSYSFDQQVGKI